MKMKIVQIPKQFKAFKAEIRNVFNFFNILYKTLDNFIFWLHKTFGSDSVSMDILAESFKRDPFPSGEDGERHTVWDKVPRTWRQKRDKNEIEASFQVSYSGLDTIDEAKKNILEHWEDWKLENFDTLEVKVKQYGRKVINLSGSVESVKHQLRQLRQLMKE